MRQLQHRKKHPFEYRASQHVLKIIGSMERRERQIDAMRPLDNRTHANKDLLLKQVMLFAEDGDIAVSLVTNHGTTNVIMSPDMVAKLGRRLLKAAKSDFSRTTLQCE
jgi:hypothetical protein